MELSKKVVVVTGAAGGIGLATANACAAAGATVVRVDVTPMPECQVVDVSDLTAMQGLAERVARDHGGADVVVNNAGVTVIGRFEDHTDADWDRVMGVNFRGVLNGCRAFLPQMVARKRGWFVNVSSLFGIVGVPGQTAYCASKFAVRGLSEALHEELRGTGIGVTVVHPGGVRTGIIDNAAVRADPAMISPLSDFFARRTVAPERVADAIVGAIRNERHRLLVCPETRVLDGLRRLAPSSGNRLAVWVMERTMGMGGLRSR